MSISTKNPLCRFGLLIVLTLPWSEATAATINWNAPATIAGDSDVSTAGNLVNAFTFGTNSVTTINGVNFLPFSTSSNSATFGGSYGSFGSGSTPYSNLSSSYQNLLTGGLYNGGGADSVTLNNLVVGHTYQVETWVNDSRGCCGAGRSETLAGNSAPTLTYNNTSAEGGVGQFVTGTFVASSTSQAISYNGAASAQVNGLEVRDMTAAVTNNVVWGAPTAITTADATIGNGLHAGSVVYATGWGNGAHTVTLGSGQQIVFQSGTIGNSPVAGNANFSGGGSGPNNFFTNGTHTTGNSVFDTVLNSAVFDGGHVNTLTLTGLTAGATYEVQLFGVDTRDCCSGRQLSFFSQGGQGAGQMTSLITEGSADYVLGRFTATGTTQVLYENLPSGSGNMNALVLYLATPEPSSCVLLGLGVLGLAAAAQRRRKG